MFGGNWLEQVPALIPVMAAVAGFVGGWVASSLRERKHRLRD